MAKIITTILLSGLFLCMPDYAQGAQFDRNVEIKDFTNCYTETAVNELLETCKITNKCFERTGKSSNDMLRCGFLDYELWDKKLNFEYNELSKLLKAFDDPESAPDLRILRNRMFTQINGIEAFEDLRDSQRIWINYRDNECRARQSRLSVLKPFTSSLEQICLAEITAERAVYFRKEAHRVTSLLKSSKTRLHPSKLPKRLPSSFD